MASQKQTEYINDLAVLKTKEFKEVKELLVARQIVAADSETVKTADSLAAVCNALNDQQASQLIDALVATKAPERAPAYSTRRIDKTIAGLDKIKAKIAGWNFNGLQ